jgi:hypothetical protein
MIASSIRWLPTLSQLSDRLGEFYDALIEELGRRYVEPTGKGTTEAINEILVETGLLEEYQSSFVLNEQHWDLRPYIALDDLPQEKDVVNALRRVRATREKDLGGRPRSIGYSPSSWQLYSTSTTLRTQKIGAVGDGRTKVR